MENGVRECWWMKLLVYEKRTREEKVNMTLIRVTAKKRAKKQG